MSKTWILVLALSIFLITIFLIWKSTFVGYKKEYGKNTWSLWGAGVYYWQGLLFISGVITFFIMLFLEWGNVLTF